MFKKKIPPTNKFCESPMCFILFLIFTINARVPNQQRPNCNKQYLSEFKNVLV